MKKLPLSFYERKNVVQIAKELLGKIVVTEFENVLTSGRIVETEAYIGLVDKASHSFNGKRSARNEHMYHCAGTAYIYICYGMHQMLNIVTNEKNIPDAILIRAIEPIEGIDAMMERTGKENLDYSITRGPGNVGKALGIYKRQSGISVLGNEIYVMEDGYKLSKDEIGISKRIGVESAGDDGLLPFRFYVKGNKYVSSRPNK
ncbi:MAG: DNA-3-methyladenine glycosylase [Ginsengibacter sp.]